MKNKKDLIKNYIAGINKKRTVLMSLATIVVFITTYMLVLPAITLEQDEAEKQGGIDLPKTEQSVDKQDQAASEDPKDAEAKKEDVKDKDASADQDTKKEEAKTEDKTDSAKAGQSSSDSEKGGLAFEGDGYSITAKAGSDAKLPDDTKLTAKEVKSDEKKYETLCEEAEKALNDSPLVKDDVSVKSAKFYDITLQSDGKDVEPAADVNVKISYDKSLKMSKSGDVYVVHFAVDKNGKSKPEVLKDSAVDVNSKAGSKSGTIEVSDVAFDASGFSMYGVVETTTLEETVVTADGKNYKVSVTYDADAKVPEGAKLAVSEIGDGDAGYDDYVAKSEKALDMEKGSAGYARLFDIKIVDKDGNKVKIQAPVDVKIELADKEDKDKAKVVHFADGSEKGDVVDNVKVDGKNISFAAEGFSVYAVIGGVEPTSRLTVNFYGKDTNTPLATMYVKNEDDLEQVNKILFDPGAGTLEEGEIFRGWVIGDIAHEGATATMPEYTVEMASTDGALKTIEDIREWAAAFDAEGNNYITEGDVVNIRAAIYKIYVVTYLDDKDVAQSAENVLIMPDDTSAYYEYTISQSYTPVKDTVKFNGWEPTDATKGHITSDTQQSDNLYQKDDVIDITGNVDFKVNQSEGHWIVFHENGKGGTYKAPQFVETGKNTVDPGTMTRKGYTFGGWYTEVTGEPDGHGYQQVVESSEFTFGGKLDDFGEGKLHLYAKWTPIQTAPYTIIFWGEKIGSNGKVEKGKYEVLESFVNNNGIVGNYIPYISRDNGVEDYAYQTGNGAFGRQLDVLPNGQNDDEKGIMGHYRGFNLTEASKNQQVTITPEGDAVLNLYYDRVQYNFKFYLYRDGTTNNRYDYANNSGRYENYFTDGEGLVTWHSNQTEHPSLQNYTINGQTVTLQSETVNGRTYYYFVMPAYYGETISDIWPTYDNINGANGRVPVSYVMMVGTHLKPRATNTGTGTVKGVISVMNWNILGTTNNADGNYVVVRFPGSSNNWRYHIWYEAIDANHVPAGKRTYTYEGKLYYEETVMAVRSSNTDEEAQNEPKYAGFDYQLRVGQNGQGVWQASNSITNTDENGHKCGTYWTTNENGTTLYHLNYIYNRQQFKITYFDGNYVDGNGNTNQNRSSQKLHESGLIPQGAEIPDEYKNYVPDAQEAGYIFKGWYLDAGCTVEYPWGTMPVGPINEGSAINVYAKWQQIQYRVYLQSNVPADEDFTWGSDSQSTCFRVTYGGKVSLPVGRGREGWEFLGWYTSPNFEPSTRFTEDYELTEANVTLPYDQDTEFTDTYDKWGNLNAPKKNTDKEEGRDWITKKLILYAKWHQKLEGADGINVVYDPIIAGQGVEPPTGHNPPTDDTYYIDTAMATAQAGSTADDTDEYQFECWVVQKWNGTAFEDTDVEVYPGDTFEVLKANAKEEDLPEPDPDNPKITKKYTVQLRAKYKPVEDPTPTHIDWYKNYEEEGKHEAFHQDSALKINESVKIQPAPTREGYTFLGWARISTEESHSHIPEGATKPVADLLNLGPDDVYIKWQDNKFWAKDKNNDWVEVTDVAADEKTPYHDMYAVWVKSYSVTIIKNVVGTDADKDNTYHFVSTGLTEQEYDSFDLYGREKTDDNDQVTQTNKKVYLEIPEYTEFQVTESDYTEDFVTTIDATYSYVNDQGETVTETIFDNKKALSTGDLIVHGNTTITYTNTRKALKVSVWKTDEDHTALTGAKFVLYKAEDYDDTTGQPIEGKSPVMAETEVDSNGILLLDVVDGEIPLGEYRLVETVAPAGYNLADSAIKIFIDSGVSAIQGTSQANVYVKGDNYWVAEQDDDTYQIQVRNNPGVALPSTGGPGTTWIYLLGTILLLGCGVTLIARRRIRQQ